MCLNAYLWPISWAATDTVVKYAPSSFIEVLYLSLHTPDTQALPATPSLDVLPE